MGSTLYFRKARAVPKILAYVHAYVGHGRNAGAETTLANLLECLVAEGWEAEVLLNGWNVTPYVHNGIYVSNETSGQTLLDKGAEADVIISHLECSERASLVGDRVGTPAVQLIHNTLWATEGYLSTEGTKMAVFNSNWVAQHHTGRDLGVLRVPHRAGGDGTMMVDFRMPTHIQTWDYVVVHPQIDPKQYVVNPTRRFVTMINFHEMKSPHIFWYLAEQHPNIQFLAVRGGYGIQDIPDVVPPNVTVVPCTDDIRNIYINTKIILMPSRYETFGRVAVEAAASGIPTICSPTEGLVEAMDIAGLYATTPEEFSTQLIALNGSSALYEEMSNRALARSAYWNEQRTVETKSFVEAMNKLIKR